MPEPRYEARDRNRRGLGFAGFRSEHLQGIGRDEDAQKGPISGVQTKAVEWLGANLLGYFEVAPPEAFEEMALPEDLDIESDDKTRQSLTS